MVQLGSVQTVIVCIPGTSSSQGVCAEGQTQSVTQAYLVAPSEAARFDLMAEPFDATTAGQYFAFAFASTIFVWLLSLGAGLVIKIVKSS